MSAIDPRGDLIPTEDLGLTTSHIVGLLCARCMNNHRFMNLSIKCDAEGKPVVVRVQCTACGNFVEWKNDTTPR